MQSFSISPKAQQVIAGFISMIGLLATASPSIFPSYIPAGSAHDIIQTAGLVSFLLGGLHFGVAGFSSSATGVWAPPDPEIVKVATAQHEVNVATVNLQKLVGVQPFDPPRPVSSLGSNTAALALMLVFGLSILVGACASIPAQADVPLPPKRPIVLAQNGGVVGALVNSVKGTAPAAVATSAPANPLSGLSGVTTGLQGLIAQLNKLIQGGLTTVIADAQSADSVAGAADPLNPGSVVEPVIHQCLAGIPGATPAVPGLISWLQNLPQPGSVPAPTGAGGAITTLVVGEATVDETQEFLAKLAVTGIPVSLHQACDSWALKLINSPATLLANANSDLVGFVSMFGKSGV